MPGPYQSEWQVRDEPMPLEVAALHDAGRVRSGDPDHVVRDVVIRHLVQACAAAGVELGDYDRRVLVWLAGLQPETAQVVIGWIGRAYAAGAGR
jgi:hypothetical protein